jgi:hypothetical protein
LNTIFEKPENRLAKSQIVQLLDGICQAIEPTESQYKDATERYTTIGNFLAEEGSPLCCYEPSVYPQGSMRIKAAIRPVNGKKFDVDLVCEFKKMPHTDPKVVKKLVWDRFHASDRYRAMVVEKNRCVQIQYAGDFHMDVMPCVQGQSGWINVGGVWVPDKKLDVWKPSNPVGFAQFVESAAAKVPRQLVALSNRRALEARSADVQPLEVEQSFTRPALIRIIQILKRHRDEFFKNDHDNAPISVVITTLATHSYDRAVTQNAYDSVYDLLLDVVMGMLDFIKVSPRTAKVWIANPSHPEENFAEKWNNDPSLSKSFYAWHRSAIAGIKALAEQEADGLDKVGAALENSFGAAPANYAVRSLSASLRDNTAAKKIAVTSGGLVTPVTFGIRTVSKNPPHTNHGG